MTADNDALTESYRQDLGGYKSRVGRIRALLIFEMSRTMLPIMSLADMFFNPLILT